MAFTHALYYPWLDIESVENQAWLKTAILYWDKLSTIVPEGYSYQSWDAAFLKSENILVPQYVDPNSKLVIEASTKFLAYLYTDEVKGLLLPETARVYRIPTIDKASKLSTILTGKMSKKLIDELKGSNRVIEDGRSLQLDQDAANYYMILLASIISKDKNLAPVTDNPNFEALLNKVWRGDAPNLPRKQRGEGLLAKITLDSIGIADETPLDDIIKFREKYKDELGNFRTKIGELALKIDSETPTFEALQQQAQDIYLNEIAPAINTLRKASRSAGFRNIATIFQSVIFAASVPYLPKDSVGSLLTGTASQLAIEGIKFSLRRKDILATEPYSFVLKVEDSLS